MGQDRRVDSKTLTRRKNAAILRATTVIYAAAWRSDNRAALASAGPLWVVLGDSTTQGIGASRRSNGYVPLVLAGLRRQRDARWRAVNLSRAGATAESVLADQVPALRLLPPADIVTCAVGINDLLRTGAAQTEEAFRRLADALPAGAGLANMPRGHEPGRSGQLNDLVRILTSDEGLVAIDLWAHTPARGRSTLAPDGVHPNDAGYRDWARAFGQALRLRAGD